MAQNFGKNAKPANGSSRLAGGPSRAEYLILFLGAVFCLLVFAHPDIVETARHGYILIRSTLDGNFLGFFEDVYSRVYGYGYTNAAHYNILLYLLYALWELPLYLIERIGGFVFTDLTLSLWCKWLGAGFYLGCGLLTVFIRYFGGYPEGVSYAILIMNVCAWFIDQVVRPARFGFTKEMKEKAKAAKKAAKEGASK